MTVDIRPETPDDIDAIDRINRLAFETPAEAGLVSALRDAGAATVSLVAELDGDVVGHILFSPVTVEGCRASVLGLGPMCVAPEHQNRGIGSQLLHAGVAACRTIGIDALVVLGHPGFYPQAGFVPASRFGIGSVYDVPDPVFMAMELRPGAFGGCSGVARYRPEFADV